MRLWLSLPDTAGCLRVVLCCTDTSTVKRKPVLIGGVSLKDWRYDPKCHCHRCSIERVLWKKVVLKA